MLNSPRTTLHASFLFLVLWSFAPARACINEYSPIPGVFIEEVGVVELGYIELDRDALLDFIISARDSCSEKPTKYCNDHVVALLYMGAYRSAYDRSASLVEQYPGEYNILITHAVACELAGSSQEALAYLERAIELNPGSHKGSEWIHRNILKARAAHNYSPRPFDLIGLELRSDSLMEPAFRPMLDTLLTQLHYQVNDRMYFARKGDDPVFGAMLFAYADLLYLTDRRSISARYYDLAMNYGFEPAVPSIRHARVRALGNTRTKLIDAETPKEQARQAMMHHRYLNLMWDAAKLKHRWAWTLGIGGVVLIAAGVLIWRRRRS